MSRDAHSSCHVLLNALKGTTTTLPEVILYYSTLKGTNLQILPERTEPFTKINIWHFVFPSAVAMWWPT